jgi:hypothetical protein
MTDALNFWPDPACPGVPLNPERDGWHWLDNNSPQKLAAYWRAAHHEWMTVKHENNVSPHYAAKYRWRYLGPCLTPAEVAAALAAQAMAMRDACAAIVDAHAAAAKRCSEEGDVIYRIRAEFLANSYAITQAADDVRVTPLPDTSALAAALAEAKREGMREAAGIAVAVRQRANDCAREPGLIANIRREYLAQARGAEDVQEAILAAAQEDKR